MNFVVDDFYGLRLFGCRARNRRKILAVDQLRRVHFDKFQHAFGDGCGGVFACHGQDVFAVNFRLDVGFAQNRIDILLDEIGLAFFDDKYRALAQAEVFDFFFDQRVGDVQNVVRDFAVAECIREAQQFEAADCGVVHAALQDDSEILRAFGKNFVQSLFVNVFLCGWPALVNFLLFVLEACRGEDDAAHVANRIFHRIFQGEFWADIVLGDKAAVDVAGADAQFEHDGSVRCFG